MPFLDFFRRRPPIRDSQALADFIDENAAFLVQKGIYEYSRARAGHYAKVLLREEPFKQAVDVSRWRAYPLGLAMVGEVVEGVLTQASDERRAERVAALSDVILGVFDRYPVPAAIGADAWSASRADLQQRLQLLGLHPPKRAMDVPEPFAKAYFDLMPIDKKLRAPDFPSITSYLRVQLCNIHDEFERRLDRPAIDDRLRAPAA